MGRVELLGGRDFFLADGSNEIIMTSEGLARSLGALRVGREPVIVIDNVVIWRARSGLQRVQMLRQSASSQP